MYVGAMENWGLVTYRETTLLIDPAQSSAAAKQTVALVVGHELAHQWFGNFVTMVRQYRLLFVAETACRNVDTASDLLVTQCYIGLLQGCPTYGPWTRILHTRHFCLTCEALLVLLKFNGEVPLSDYCNVCWCLIYRQTAIA